MWARVCERGLSALRIWGKAPLLVRRLWAEGRGEALSHVWAQGAESAGKCRGEGIMKQERTFVRTGMGAASPGSRARLTGCAA